MQVCLDGRFAGQRGGTGVSTYAAALAAVVPQAGFDLQLLSEEQASRCRARRWVQAATLVTARSARLGPPSTRRVGDAFRLAQVHFDVRRSFLALQDSSAPPTVMHWTYPMPLYFRNVPNVYTVHDLIPLIHPALTGIAGPRMRRLFGQLRRRAAHLVTVSEASRQEIIQELSWPADRVTNTYQAVMDSAPSAAVTADALARFRLQPDGYVLHAGTVEPRKNLRRLIQAYRASGISKPLVVAGPDGWHAGEELEGIADTPGLRRLPWVDRPAMLALLCGARFVAAPSLAEGFGLLVAEGMAFGTPVLTSGMGATAEVAGGAALLVDPSDGAALTAAIRALDADPALRAELRDRGLRRSSLFSPSAYAARLQRLYTGLAGKGYLGGPGDGRVGPGDRPTAVKHTLRRFRDKR